MGTHNNTIIVKESENGEKVVVTKPAKVETLTPDSNGKLVPSTLTLEKNNVITIGIKPKEPVK